MAEMTKSEILERLNLGNSVAENDESEPDNLPIGVRAPARMTMGEVMVCS